MTDPERIELTLAHIREVLESGDLDDITTDRPMISYLTDDRLLRQPGPCVNIRMRVKVKTKPWQEVDARPTLDLEGS